MRGRGLISARACSRPHRIPKPRPRRGSAKAAGLAYEKSVGEALWGSVRGQWFEFQDSQGLGWCQVDLLVEGEREILVLEVKFSWLLEAHLKLEALYLPVVRMALGKPTIGLVVARRLTPEIRQEGIKYSSDLKSALGMARNGRACLHWLPGQQVFKEAA